MLVAADGAGACAGGAIATAKSICDVLAKCVETLASKASGRSAMPTVLLDEEVLLRLWLFAVSAMVISRLEAGNN